MIASRLDIVTAALSAHRSLDSQVRASYLWVFCQPLDEKAAPCGWQVRLFDVPGGIFEADEMHDRHQAEAVLDALDSGGDVA